MNEQFQNTIIKVEVPIFGSDSTIEFLKRMGMCGQGTEIVKPRNRYARRDTRTLQFTFSHYKDRLAQSFLSAMAKTFHPDFLKIEVTKVPAYHDDWELYEHLLSVMDWYYAFSDDHRVWCAGEAAISRLRTLREELSKSDKDRADKLWEKYAR